MPGGASLHLLTSTISSAAGWLWATLARANPRVVRTTRASRPTGSGRIGAGCLSKARLDDGDGRIEVAQTSHLLISTMTGPRHKQRGVAQLVSLSSPDGLSGLRLLPGSRVWMAFGVGCRGGERDERGWAAGFGSGWRFR